MQDKREKKELGQYYTPIDVAKVMAEWLDKQNGFYICDVACGTGRLILTYLDFVGKDRAIELLRQERIYLYDLDKTALNICKTTLLLKYGKDLEPFIHTIQGDFLSQDIKLQRNCKVISNPPYTTIKKIKATWENTDVAKNTKELYTMFMEKIIKQSKSSVIITPYSFIGGQKFFNLRKLMNNYSGFIVSFDNVPGNIFYGKKQGIFNTNTSNSVRAAITVVENNNCKGFRLSPLIRFKNEERKSLLQCKLLEGELSNKYQIVNSKKPSYEKCQKELQVVFDKWLEKSFKNLKDVISSKKENYKIYIPNTCRYFTTASVYKLKRAGAIELYIKDIETFNFVYCLINSSFAYWWWRIYDGGITYSKGLLQKLPIFINLLTDDDKKFFKDTANEMINTEKDYIVTKLNSGKIQENIKFPEKYRNIINQRLLDILGFKDLNSSIFNCVHKNKFS